jgi:hypothetical protein
VEFYVDEHNRVLPHSAFRGQTPDEMYFGTGDTVPADLTSGAAAARRARRQAVKILDWAQETEEDGTIHSAHSFSRSVRDSPMS